MVERIFIYFMGGILILSVLFCAVYISYERIKDLPPKKKILSILFRIIIIAAYVAVIYFIRVNPTMIAYRKSNGAKVPMLIIMALFLVFYIGGVLYYKQYKSSDSKAKKTGEFMLLLFRGFVPYIIFGLVPIILALDI